MAGDDESIEEDDEVRKQSCTFQEKINCLFHDIIEKLTYVYFTMISGTQNCYS